MTLNLENISLSISNTDIEGNQNSTELQNDSVTVESDEHLLEKTLNVFLTDLFEVQKTNRMLMPHVLVWLKEEHEKNSLILNKYRKDTDLLEYENFRAMGVHETTELFGALREIENLEQTKIPATLVKSLFTQIFSEFDAFIGALLKIIYSEKPELLKNISREITYENLSTYNNIEAIKQEMLEKQIDSFRRGSYVDQFTTMESKFVIKLREFKEWGEFVELSQRRNILVHNGGRVNEQYLKVCNEQGFKFDSKPLIGELLKPTVKYFNRAILVISKVGFMLTHTLWRKLFPNEIEKAHTAINNTLYELLKEKRWHTGAEIAAFSLNNQMTHSINDLELRLRTVNAAIASKFSENHSSAIDYINSIDWTASNKDFKLAIAVLEDRYIDAARIMKEIGRNGDLIKQFAYHEWPLFHKFRDTPEFLNTYQEVYQASFVRESVKNSANAVVHADDFNSIQTSQVPIIENTIKNN
jgi:hypothetical protein